MADLVRTRRCALVLAGIVLAACGGGSGRAVGGTVKGLAGRELVLRNGSERLVLVGPAASEPFSFSTRIAIGSAYDVSVEQQPTNPPQVCTVSNGRGQVGKEDVASILVICAASASHTVGGVIEGLAGQGLVLQNNGGDDLTLSAASSIPSTFHFAGAIAEGGVYGVTILQQPTNPSQICQVTNGSGTMGGADVDGVRVICTAAIYSIGGTITGLKGSGLVLENAGGERLAVPPNATMFEFTTRFAEGNAYDVTVLPRAVHDPMQKCVVRAGTGSGTVGQSNVTAVQVDCKYPVAGYLYVANSDARSVWGFPVQVADGKLVTASVVKTGDGMQSPFAIAIDPAGRFAYVTSGKDGYTQGEISGYSIDTATGALTWIGTSPETGRYPYSVAIDPTGHLAYVANGMDHVVSAYSIDEQSGQLKALSHSPFDVGQYPISVAVDPSGRYVYTANHGDAGYNSGVSFSRIHRDVASSDTNGELTLIGSLVDEPIGVNGYAAEVSVAVEPSGRFVYVVNYNGEVNGFAILDTGVLRPLSGSPWTAGTGPIAAAIDPSGRFLYVANQVSKDISAFSIDGLTGALTRLTGSPFVPADPAASPARPVHIAVDPSGRFVYLADLVGRVQLYSITPGTGALTFADSVAVEIGASNMAITSALVDTLP